MPSVWVILWAAWQTNSTHHLTVGQHVVYPESAWKSTRTQWFYFLGGWGVRWGWQCNVREGSTRRRQAFFCFVCLFEDLIRTITYESLLRVVSCRAQDTIHCTAHEGSTPLLTCPWLVRTESLAWQHQPANTSHWNQCFTKSYGRW